MLNYNEPLRFLPRPARDHCLNCGHKRVPYTTVCAYCDQQFPSASQGEAHRLSEHPEGYTRIAHLTDLHVHNPGQERQGPSRFYQLAQWFEAVAEHGVDGVVISGDLIETPGDEKTLELVQRRIDKFGLNYCVVPGNHDLTLDPKYDPFYGIFGAYPRVEAIGQVDFILFDSLAGLPVENRSLMEAILQRFPVVDCWTEGTIGEAQFQNLSKLLDDSDASSRVAVVHHHIHSQPPDPLIGRLVTNATAGTMKPLFDGHKIVSWARKNGVNTVLHGHKHGFMQPGYTEGVLVMNGGSSTQHPRRNQARIIDFGPGGEKVVHQVELKT